MWPVRERWRTTCRVTGLSGLSRKVATSICRSALTVESKVRLNESPAFSYPANFSTSTPGPAWPSDAVPAFITTCIFPGSGGTYWWTRAVAASSSAFISPFFFSITLPRRPRFFSGGGGSTTAVFCTLPSAP